MDTDGHTSVRRLAVKSLRSLCLRIGNPPVGQLSLCSTVNGWPHWQLEASIGGSHPYLRCKASRKAPLCRLKLQEAGSKPVSLLFLTTSLDLRKPPCGHDGSRRRAALTLPSNIRLANLQDELICLARGAFSSLLCKARPSCNRLLISPASQRSSLLWRHWW